VEPSPGQHADEAKLILTLLTGHMIARFLELDRQATIRAQLYAAIDCVIRQVFGSTRARVNHLRFVLRFLFKGMGSGQSVLAQ
jgi:hypothetical protein